MGAQQFEDEGRRNRIGSTDLLEAIVEGVRGIERDLDAAVAGRCQRTDLEARAGRRRVLEKFMRD